MASAIFRRCASAPYVSHAVAVSATRLNCALRRLAATAKYCCNAASLRLRTRPNRSSSNSATPTPAVNCSLTPASVPWRCIWPVTATPGTRSARCTRYWPRARSTLSTATRRSRLFCSDCSITCCRRASVKKSRQPTAATSATSPCAASAGHCAGIAGATAVFFGTRVEQPASASAAAMERNRDALFMGMTSIGTAGWQEVVPAAGRQPRWIHIKRSADAGQRPALPLQVTSWICA